MPLSSELTWLAATRTYTTRNTVYLLMFRGQGVDFQEVRVSTLKRSGCRLCVGGKHSSDQLES